jgi:hypothetical protein
MSCSALSRTPASPSPTSQLLKDIAIHPVTTHKHLRTVLDQALHWREQAKATIAKGTRWILMFERLANIWRGMHLEQMQQLYMAVAVPKALYTVDVWLTPPRRVEGAKRTRGLVGFVCHLETMQRLATIAITGAFRTQDHTTGNSQCTRKCNKWQPRARRQSWSTT